MKRKKATHLIDEYKITQPLWRGQTRRQKKTDKNGDIPVPGTCSK